MGAPQQAMLAIPVAYEAVSRVGAATSNSVSTATSLAINKPTGAAAGDLCIAWVAAGTGSNSGPSGWTKHGSYTGFNNVELWYKILDGGEGASFTWGYPTSVDIYGIVTCYRDASATTPVNEAQGSANHGASTSPTAPSVFVQIGGVGTAFFHCYGPSGRTYTAPSGYTEDVDAAFAATIGSITFMHCDKLYPSTAVSGVLTATQSGDATASYGYQASIRPAPV